MKVIQKIRNDAVTVKENETGTLCGGKMNPTDKVPNMVIKSNTIAGEETASPGDSINYSQPNSKTRRGRVGVGVGVAQTLDTQVNQGVVIQVLTPDRPTKRQNGRRFKDDGDDAHTLTGQDKHGILLEGMQIRRLTEIECERLQGFPDNWTKMGNYDGQVKEISRTQRYKLCGNAVTVAIVELIGRKLMQ